MVESSRGGRGGRPRAGGRDVAISKCLSYILRHGAVELGLNMRSDGYVPLNEILEVPSVKSKEAIYLLILICRAKGNN